MTGALLEVEGLSKRFARGGKSICRTRRRRLRHRAWRDAGAGRPLGQRQVDGGAHPAQAVEPDAGSVRFDGMDLLALKGAALRAMRARLQMVFQDPLAAFNPRATVARLLDDPLRIHGIVPRGERPKAIAGLLARVGLSAELAGRGVHEISGGQRQRVAIARALATKPSLIVLDEAVAALDVLVRSDILRLLADLQRQEGIAYLFISHDLGAVRAIAHRIAIMDAGRIVEQGEASAVIAAPASATGRALVAAAPELPRIAAKENAS